MRADPAIDAASSKAIAAPSHITHLLTSSINPRKQGLLVATLQCDSKTHHAPTWKGTFWWVPYCNYYTWHETHHWVETIMNTSLIGQKLPFTYSLQEKTPRCLATPWPWGHSGCAMKKSNSAHWLCQPSLWAPGDFFFNIYNHGLQCLSATGWFKSTMIAVSCDIYLSQSIHLWSRWKCGMQSAYWCSLKGISSSSGRML